MKIAFRPHHFLCTLGFRGSGYSPHFVKNYTQIVEALQRDEELPIQVIEGADSICAACPHQSIEGCAVEEKIQGLDARHAHILNLKAGGVLSWKEAQQRLKDHMTIEAFHHACAGCEWKAWGVCEIALRKLRAEER
jgi:hypothetical protein